jgi:hypothetical protein
MIKNPTFAELNKLDDWRQVQRNFQCPEYNECLSNAAYQNLDLHCRQCPLKNMTQKPFITEHEIYGSISLVTSIFC